MPRTEMIDIDRNAVARMALLVTGSRHWKARLALKLQSSRKTVGRYYDTGKAPRTFLLSLYGLVALTLRDHRAPRSEWESWFPPPTDDRHARLPPFS